MSKICTKCGKEKDSGIDFNKDTRKQYAGQNRVRSQCKVCEREYSRHKRSILKERVFKVLGDRCTRCGFSDKRSLQIDHVNGSGVAEHAEVKNPGKFYLKVLSDTTGKYQILCANCNWIKRAENNENPTYENIMKTRAAASSKI